jgi:ubiquinone/menaquinone biosynthesis C-methylase UbiE
MAVALFRAAKTFIYRNLHLYPPLKKYLVQRDYNRIARETEGRNLTFMNYGYASLDPSEPSLELFDEDVFHRFQIQLYHHLASQAELEGKRVLEVGSGQGGGSYFLKRYMRSKSVTGVDLAKNNVARATETYPMEGLYFCQGDAERLPFAGDSFDLVVNVESSHCYPRIDRFYREVKRVLCPEGYFLYADLMPENRVERTRTQLKEAGLATVTSREITENVIEAIRLFDEDRGRQIRAVVKSDERYHVYSQWTRMVGTKGFQAFCDRKDQYWSYVLQKPI